jgi:glycosyltransferase involved in cell wall biosynthesis
MGDLMNIVLLTSYIHPELYTHHLNSNLFINPSHQHYYDQLTQSIALNKVVHVISYTALSTPKGFQKVQKKGRILFHTPKRFLGRLMHIYIYYQYAKKLIQKLAKNDQTMVLLDGNSASLAFIASWLRRVCNVHIIPVVTDLPSSLSKPSRTLQWVYENIMPMMTGFICLTEGLNQHVNTQHKPVIYLPGFCEERHASSPHKKPYFFFSGALYERYGIHQLLQAFIKLNQPDIDLVIAGHGPESTLIERLSQSYPNIQFLGLIDQQTVYRYQADALANLNPRLRDDHFDQLSIPSKMFDYLSSGVPTISVIHPFFYTRFPKDVEWLDEGSIDEWVFRLKQFLASDLSLLRDEAQRLKQKMLATFNHHSQGQMIVDFLNSLKTSSST